jgi:hypothetical protein
MNQKQNNNQVGRVTFGPLFSTQTDVVLFGVEESAEFYGRILITEINRVSSIDNPNRKYLIDKAVDYIKTVITSAIIINPTSENPLKLKGLANYTLTLLYIPDLLHNALNVIGEVKYRGHGVKRIISYNLDKSAKLMSSDEALNYSSELKDYMAGSKSLVQGVPHNQYGDADAMSCILVEEMDAEGKNVLAERLCSHMDKDMPDREYMSSLFPRLEKSNTRIPAVVLHGEGADLRYTLRSLK